MIKQSKFFFGLIIVAALSACSTMDVRNDDEIVNKDDYRNKRMGKLFGEDAFLFSSDDLKDEKSGGSGIGVNAYLWRATLETISFMSLKSTDPFGGVIITEWYIDPQSPKERIKLDVLIQDRRLRADALRVKMTRQVLNEKGNWVNAASNPSAERDLEDTILFKARQLKMADGK